MIHFLDGVAHGRDIDFFWREKYIQNSPIPNNFLCDHQKI